MNFIFSGLFWGIIIVIIGISIILNSIFNINIPIFKIILALFFIYLGVSMITQESITKDSPNLTLFSESLDTKKPKEDEYNTIFGTSKLDLTDLDTKNSFKSNTIFGTTTIYVNTNKSTKIEASSAFSQIIMPSKDSVNFGSLTYKTASFDEENYIDIKISAVFASVEIKEK